jgi:hypothetical protein
VKLETFIVQAYSFTAVIPPGCYGVFHVFRWSQESDGTVPQDSETIDMKIMKI